MNVMYFQHTIREMVMNDIKTYSVVMGETYDMIELLYQATKDKWESEGVVLSPNFTARDYFAENFCMWNPYTGKCIQWLYHEEYEGFAEQWGWAIDEEAIRNFFTGEEDC